MWMVAVGRGCFSLICIGCIMFQVSGSYYWYECRLIEFNLYLLYRCDIFLRYPLSFTRGGTKVMPSIFSQKL
jgi:hypothetical protein